MKNVIASADAVECKQQLETNLLCSDVSATMRLQRFWGCAILLLHLNVCFTLI
jgi:hypothetical protein